MVGTKGGAAGAKGGVAGTKGGVVGTKEGVVGTKGGVAGDKGGVADAKGGVAGTKGGAKGGVAGAKGGVTSAKGGMAGAKGGVTGGKGVDPLVRMRVSDSSSGEDTEVEGEMVKRSRSSTIKTLLSSSGVRGVADGRVGATGAKEGMKGGVAGVQRVEPIMVSDSSSGEEGVIAKKSSIQASLPRSGNVEGVVEDEMSVTGAKEGLTAKGHVTGAKEGVAGAKGHVTAAKEGVTSAKGHVTSAKEGVTDAKGGVAGGKGVEPLVRMRVSVSSSGEETEVEGEIVKRSTIRASTQLPKPGTPLYPIPMGESVATLSQRAITPTPPIASAKALTLPKDSPPSKVMSSSGQSNTSTLHKPTSGVQAIQNWTFQVSGGPLTNSPGVHGKVAPKPLGISAPKPLTSTRGVRGKVSRTRCKGQDKRGKARQKVKPMRRAKHHPWIVSNSPGKDDTASEEY